MGLVNRDDMLESRTPSPFSAKPYVRPGLGLPQRMLVWLAVGVVLWFGFRWLEKRKAQPKPPVAQQVAPAPAPAPEAQKAPAPAGMTPLANKQYVIPPPAGTHRVHKCTQSGQTVYSDDPCPSGAVASTLQFQNQPAAPAKRPAPVASPPPAAPAVNQVVVLQAAPQATVDPNAMRQAECQALDQEITRLDAYARQLLPAVEQDRVRTLRQRARDRQFAIHC